MRHVEVTRHRGRVLRVGDYLAQPATRWFRHPVPFDDLPRQSVPNAFEVLDPRVDGRETMPHEVEDAGARGLPRATQVEDVPNLVQREAESLGLPDESQFVDRRVVVATIAGRGPRASSPTLS